MESQQLAAHVMRVDRTWLLAHPKHEFNDLAGEGLLQRREAGEPLAYILGWREFYGRTFGVDPSVLVPRHETEVLVETALQLGPPEGTFSVLDMGTGSGILAVTLKLERPAWEVTAVDISSEALTTASANAKFLEARVRFVLSDGFEGLLGESFDMIVCNPPYIGHAEVLPHEVRAFEPSGALFADNGGLAFYERLAAEAPAYLSDGGLLLVEVGHTQAEQVRMIFEGAAWSVESIRSDLSGIERVVVLRYAFECHPERA